MRRLILVRHGESIWNAETRIQGQACNGLSAVGHAQSAATAAALASVHPGARLVTSDLQRTVETAAPLAEVLAREPEHEPRLRERSFGGWQGRLRDEVASAEPERWRRWLQGEDVVGEVGGESAEQLADRATPVLAELLSEGPDGGTVIAVTHGGPIWNGLHRLLGLPLGTLGGVDNASVTELVRSAGGDPVLAVWNSSGHLPVELRTGAVPARRPDGRERPAGSPARTVSDAPPVGR